MNAIQMMFARKDKWAMGARRAAERYAEATAAAREKMITSKAWQDTIDYKAAYDAEQVFIRCEGKAAAKWLDKIRAAITAA